MKETYTIPLLCVFCNTPLQKKENKEYQSGDLIECKECGKYNDYDSIFQIGKEKGIKQVEDNIMAELTKSLNNFGK